MAKTFRSLQKQTMTPGRIAAARTAALETVEDVDDSEAPEAYGKRAIATLDGLAAKLKEGVMYEDLQDEIDALLGTDMSPRDREAEALWEGSRRK